jgi:hypothetical protein
LHVPFIVYIFNKPGHAAHSYINPHWVQRLRRGVNPQSLLFSHRLTFGQMCLVDKISPCDEFIRVEREAPLAGKVMSVAKQVSDVEPHGLAWLEIEDEDGAKYRYFKKALAPDRGTVHIEAQFTGGHLRAQLVRQKDGQPVLRQNEPGLPSKTVVSHIQLAAMPGVPIMGGWGANYEYEQE